MGGWGWGARSYILSKHKSNAQSIRHTKFTKKAKEKEKKKKSIHPPFLFFFSFFSSKFWVEKEKKEEKQTILSDPSIMQGSVS